MKLFGIVLLAGLAFACGCNSKQRTEPQAIVGADVTAPPDQIALEQLTPEEEKLLEALKQAFKPDLDPATPFTNLAPQFAVFDLPEFKQEDISMMRGLGGRWVSARWVSTSEVAELSRHELTNRLASAYRNAGWLAGPRPHGRQKYVLSDIWETSTDDLWFTGPKGFGSASNAFFSCAVHVSTNADVVCLYTEIGW